jgi:hypothetical protein
MMTLKVGQGQLFTYLEICPSVGNPNFAFGDPSFINYCPRYVYWEIMSMTYDDLESRSRSIIHIFGHLPCVGKLHAKFEDPSFFIY